MCARALEPRRSFRYAFAQFVAVLLQRADAEDVVEVWLAAFRRLDRLERRHGGRTIAELRLSDPLPQSPIGRELGALHPVELFRSLQVFERLPRLLAEQVRQPDTIVRFRVVVILFEQRRVLAERLVLLALETKRRGEVRSRYMVRRP